MSDSTPRQKELVKTWSVESEEQHTCFVWGYVVTPLRAVKKNLLTPTVQCCFQLWSQSVWCIELASLQLSYAILAGCWWAEYNSWWSVSGRVAECVRSIANIAFWKPHCFTSCLMFFANFRKITLVTMQKLMDTTCFKTWLNILDINRTGGSASYASATSPKPSKSLILFLFYDSLLIIHHQSIKL